MSSTSSADGGTTSDPVGAGRGGRRRTVVPYDFRRPQTFNREHARALEIANETFARQFSTVLSTTLRSVSPVGLASVSQRTYDEHVRTMANPSYLAVLDLAPLPGQSLLHLPLDVVMAIVDRLLGGPGSGRYPQRALSDIEDALIRNLMARVLRELNYAYESLAALDATVARQESNPQFVQVAAPSDMVVVSTFDIRVGAYAGQATLGIPLRSLQSALDAVTAGTSRSPARGGEGSGLRLALDARVADAPVEVSVRFGTVPLRSSDIVGLQPGDVVPLHHPVAAPLTVAVAGVPRFSAVAGRHGSRLACLIVDPNSEEHR